MPRRLALILLLPATACADGDAQQTISDDTFIEVMVGLRRASAETGADTARFEAMRDSILRSAGTTDAALYAWVDARAREPRQMGRVFAAIRDSLRTLPDTTGH